MIFTKEGVQTEVRERMRGGNGEAVFTQYLKSGEYPPNCRVFSVITLKPGCEIGEHVHENECEFFYMLSGSARATDDGACSVLHAGDILLTNAGHRHAMACEGNTPASFLAVIVTE